MAVDENNITVKQEVGWIDWEFYFFWEMVDCFIFELRFFLLSVWKSLDYKLCIGRTEKN